MIYLFISSNKIKYSVLSHKLWITFNNIDKESSYYLNKQLLEPIWIIDINTSKFIEFNIKNNDSLKLRKYLNYILSSTWLLKIDLLLLLDTEYYNTRIIRDIYDNIMLYWWNVKLLDNWYLWFNNVKKKILEISKLIDYNFESLDLNKIEFIWEILDVYYNSDTITMKFTNLVSIIEFLLINWKDNITQQFIFKTSIIYEKVYSKYLDKKILQEIYEIRSKIVHGNYVDLDLDKTSSSYIQLLEIVYTLLNYYLKNPNYINFIKDWSLWKD